MTEAREPCSYCGHRDAESEGPKCSICEMSLGDSYIILRGTDTEKVKLCSIECLDIYEESKNTEGE